MSSKKRRIKQLQEGPDCDSGGRVVSYHLENGGSKKRRGNTPKAETTDVIKIAPENNNLNQSRMLTWHIQTGSFAYRFLLNCVQMTLIPGYKNKQYTSADAQEVDKRRFWNASTPFKVNPDLVTEPNSTRVAFMNPLSTVSPMVEEVEVYLQNQLVQTNRSGFISIANALNNLFLPSAKRREILGHPYMLHNENDRKKLPGALSKFYQSESYKYALSSFDCVKEDKDARAITVRGNLYGIWPLSPPKNFTLDQISRCPSGMNLPPLLPPQTELTIRMRLAEPLYKRAIDSMQGDDNFFSNTNPVDTAHNFRDPVNSDFHYDIKSMYLLAERIKWDDEQIQRQLERGEQGWFFEQYVFRNTGLEKGRVVSHVLDTVPPRTRLIYLFVCKSNQLYRDGNNIRSSDCSRFAIPSNLEKVVIRLNGRVILFESGLTMSRDMAHSQEDSGLFYEYLRDRNLTDDSFETFFPKNGAIGYKNAIPIDLNSFNLEEPGNMHIELWWDASGCPEDHWASLFMPQEANISRDSPSSIWKSTATIS